MLNAYEGNVTATLIEGAAIDSITSSLNLLRKLDPPPVISQDISIQDIINKIALRGASKLDDCDLHKIFCTEQILAKEHGD